MENKVLVVATVASTIDQFCMNDIEILLHMGKKVHVLANFKNGNNTSDERIKEFKNELLNKEIVIHDTDMNRSPFSIMNFKEYNKIKGLVNSEKFDLIHCHTPIAAIITRLAARKARKQGTTVMYTAHGFHFFKGAPLLNWLLYYPIEKICSYFTDVLITINQEDYILAKKRMKATEVCYVPGVGINAQSLMSTNVDREKKRKELGIPADATMLLSVGELNKNKNHEVIIKALKNIDTTNIYYCIAGKGELEGYLKELVISLGLEERVRFLGFRKDVKDIYKVSDIFCFPSHREGLSVALMEAMATGLPVICSKIRGNVDLVKQNDGGKLCAPESIQNFSEAIRDLVDNKNKLIEMGRYNQEIVRELDIKNIKGRMSKIYSK